MGNLIKKIRENLLRRYIVTPMIILLLVPMLMSILFGFEFVNVPYKEIPTVIVNKDNSATTRSLVQMIENNSTFRVIPGSEQKDIEDAFYHNTAMAGIYIPEDFSKNLLNGKEAKIMIFNDGAMSPAASSVRGAVAETMGTIKSGFLIKLVEGKFNASPQEAVGMISPIGSDVRMLGNPTKNITYMFLEGILLTSVQVGVVAVGSSIRERRSYKLFLLKGLICAIVGSISAFLCVFIQTKWFGFPYRGSVLAGELITFFCCLGFSFFGMFSNLSAKGDIEGAVQKCSTIGLTMLLSGYTYPVISMPGIFAKIEWFIPNTHYIIPFRDIALLGSNCGDMKPHITWMIGFSILMLLLATSKFLSEKFVIPKAKAKVKKKNKKAKKNPGLVVAEE